MSEPLSINRPDTPVERPGAMTVLSQLLRLAAPLLAAQLLNTGTGVVDTMMSGHYSANDLAAVAIGNSIWLPLFLLIAGVMIAVTSMVARFHGAQQRDAIITTTQQGIWLGLMIASLVALLLANSDFLLRWFDVNQQVAPITSGYLFAVAYGMPAAAVFSGLRSFCEGMGKTQPYLIASLVAFLANIPLNYALIYGQWGFPELGGVGCGWATAMSMWLQVVLLIIFTRSPSSFHDTDLWAQWGKPVWADIRKVAGLGLPIALGVFAEVSIFSAIALLLAPLGANIVAGHQIALNVSHLIFMLPLSLSQAITIRVGYFLGQHQQAIANFVVKIGLMSGMCLSLMTMSLILLGREYIVLLYTTDPAVIALALPLFLWMAIYQFPDQLQIVANASLRAYQDTRVPLRIILFAYWGVCLPLGFVLARTDLLVEPIAAKGFWIGLVVGLTLTAILLLTRLYRTARKPLA
jgi:MATE family, multidrug efflux pump